MFSTLSFSYPLLASVSEPIHIVFTRRQAMHFHESYSYPFFYQNSPRIACCCTSNTVVHNIRPATSRHVAHHAQQEKRLFPDTALCYHLAKHVSDFNLSIQVKTDVVSTASRQDP